jgi:hypothetical protein
MTTLPDAGPLKDGLELRSSYLINLPQKVLVETGTLIGLCILTGTYTNKTEYSVLDIDIYIRQVSQQP